MTLVLLDSFQERSVAADENLFASARTTVNEFGNISYPLIIQLTSSADNELEVTYDGGSNWYTVFPDNTGVVEGLDDFRKDTIGVATIYATRGEDLNFRFQNAATINFALYVQVD